MKTILSEIRRSPISARFLLILYFLFGIRALQRLLDPYSMSDLAMATTALEAFLSATLVFLILYRQGLSWKIGLAESVLTAAVSFLLYWDTESLMAEALKFNLDDSQYGSLSQSEIATALQVGFWSGLIFIAAELITKLIFWIRLRHYNLRKQSSIRI